MVAFFMCLILFIVTVRYADLKSLSIGLGLCINYSGI
jgi:hypothetical protein